MNSSECRDGQRHIQKTKEGERKVEDGTEEENVVVVAVQRSCLFVCPHVCESVCGDVCVECCGEEKRARARITKEMHEIVFSVSLRPLNALTS